MMRYFAALVIFALAVFAVIAFFFGWETGWPVVTIILGMIFGMPLVEMTLEYWFGPPPPDVVAVENERPGWLR